MLKKQRKDYIERTMSMITVHIFFHERIKLVQLLTLQNFKDESFDNKHFFQIPIETCLLP